MGSASRPITSHVPLPPESVEADFFVCGRDYTNWRPKGSGDWLVILTTAGCGWLVAEGKGHRLPAGCALLYAPGARQDYSTEAEVGHWELAWAHFQPRAHWLPWLHWPQVARGVGILSVEPAEAARGAEAALRRAAERGRAGLAGAKELAMNALEEALLWAREAGAGSRWASVDPRVRAAMDFFAANPERPFSMAQLARHCGLSESRLGHLFTRETGMSPQRYAEELKMERARQLLARTAASVGEVAAACGYADAFYFSRRFAKATGKSPTEWRRSRD